MAVVLFFFFLTVNESSRWATGEIHHIGGCVIEKTEVKQDTQVHKDTKCRKVNIGHSPIMNTVDEWKLITQEIYKS
ncbi:hypothetical protein HanIR_Chr17g0876991 [Helianthus annuus]|nr:hypothetical protein HanIR_Chr17g0876991 [Helianthus annuus]